MKWCKNQDSEYLQRTVKDVNCGQWAEKSVQYVIDGQHMIVTSPHKAGQGAF